VWHPRPGERTTATHLQQLFVGRVGPDALQIKHLPAPLSYQRDMARSLHPV